jgi:hypothetical protein
MPGLSRLFNPMEFDRDAKLSLGQFVQFSLKRQKDHIAFIGHLGYIPS